jgi:NAD(P)-dependent dehydrogenase (short-subunit alcohol dehydrogenase family)
MAVLFAREGARIAVADRNEASAGATSEIIRKEGGSPVTIAADVLKPADIRAMIERAVSSLGGLDGIVFNVGIGVGATGLTRATAEDWDKALAVNLRGAMLTAQAALPVLAEESAIVFISSVASIVPGSRLPSYDASKAALGALMRHVALEGKSRGIRANVIAPGLMDTSIGRAATRGRPSRAKTPVPLGRQGTGWETAYAALFLISNESAYVTGQTLIVDGGLTALK